MIPLQDRKQVLAETSQNVTELNTRSHFFMNGYWILLGMMGAGKSTVGRKLADLAQVPFEDADALLERRFGRPIHQVFSIYGEETFRGHETSILKSLNPKPGVLATGGGIVTRPENWDELHRLGRTIYLNVPAEALMMRLEKSKRRRPLLETENWQGRFTELFDARLPLYMKADIVFDVQIEDLEACAARLYEQLKVAP